MPIIREKITQDIIGKLRSGKLRAGYNVNEWVIVMKSAELAQTTTGRNELQHRRPLQHVLYRMWWDQAGTRIIYTSE